MSHIVIHRDHPLTLDEAPSCGKPRHPTSRALRPNHHWQDDSCTSERSGVGGQIELEPGSCRINVRLGLSLGDAEIQLEQKFMLIWTNCSSKPDHPIRFKPFANMDFGQFGWLRRGLSKPSDRTLC